MKHVMFLLIGIMMAGGMAAAEATGNESATKATIPIGSTIVIPVSEGSKEVVFDVEGVEITTQAELEAVEGEGWLSDMVSRFCDGLYKGITGRDAKEDAEKAGETIGRSIRNSFDNYCNIVYDESNRKSRGWLSLGSL